MSAHYDAVIVGGGIAGAITARMLSEAGKRVLILEAGIEGAMKPASYLDYLETYYTIGGVRGMPNGPYPYNAAAPSPGMPFDPTGGYYAYATPTQFMSDYLRMLGGTTLHWQGTSLRMVPNDFRMQSTYGHGVDWPIGYDDLEPDYRRAELEIGVAADVDDQRIFGVWFPDGYVYPMHRMPQSMVDQFFDRTLRGRSVRLAGKRYPLRVISIPQGRNATPNAAYDLGRGYRPDPMVSDRDEGQRCQGNSACLPLCPVQAKYSALKTLDALRRNRGVEIRTQSVASKLHVDPATGRIRSVEYKRYAKQGSPEHVTETVSGTLVVLAANAIENATLLLASNAANRSDQVGRNLMDHPYLYVWGLAPTAVFPFRGPDTTSGVESLRDGAFRKVHASFRASLANWGWSGAPGAQLAQLLGKHVYGKSLRAQLADQMRRMVKIGFMFEQLPDPNNRVSIDGAHRDAMGNHRPVLSYAYDSYSLSAVDAAVNTVWKSITEYAGIEDFTAYPNPAPGGYQRVTYEGTGYNIMGSGHIVGTHRMGHSWRDSVVDRNSRSWDHDNLYIVGAGSQVTIGTANPTLTAAALTVRAARAMLGASR
ncbi:MAG: GMC family oxidoreductase [Gemmatimonadaceae bacterium]|nr:GMC family oxidoreductase [Gemmatimonadaceae bacterium]